MGLFTNWLRPSKLPQPDLGFRVGDGLTDWIETIGDLAVPVGGVLSVWDPKSFRMLEFELTAIEAKQGDLAVARFIARKNPRPRSPLFAEPDW